MEAKSHTLGPMAKSQGKVIQADSLDTTAVKSATLRPKARYPAMTLREDLQVTAKG